MFNLEFIKNNKYTILGIFLVSLCLVYSAYFIYESNNVNYAISEVEMQSLYAVEQNVYVKNTINSFLDVKNEVSEFESIEKSANSIEKQILNGVNNIKIKEIKEEYRVQNRLASRPLSEDVGSNLETDAQKYARVFGDGYVPRSNRSMYYSTYEEAISHMVGFYTDVWNINSSGEWYKKNVYIQCHESLEATMKNIFNDLIDLPEEERTPIKDIGMFSYRWGCHGAGVALDINWNENAEMTNSGVVTAGSYWRPDSDIYSIAPNSKMVEIFKSYGFGWGGEWTSKKDYMHFSYFDK